MISDDDNQIERLIDGELLPGEQRTLLESLDETADGWRRIALGLLESRSFQREFRDYLPIESTSVGRSETIATRSAERYWPVALMAVIGLCGMAMGMGAEHLRQSASLKAEPFSKTVAGVTSTAPVESLIDSDSHPTLKLVFTDELGDGQTVDVSVMDATDADAEDLLHQSAIPHGWRMALEAQGYVIQEERRYVTVTLADGRQGIAPVSNVVVKHHTDMFQ